MQTKHIFSQLTLTTGILFLCHNASARQALVTLGTAGNFAVLAGSTVTSTGGTTVKGDLGVWAGSAVTGFAGIVPGGPGTVTGTIHAGDATAQIAQGDLTTAYNDAAGRTVAPINVNNADLGGLTLGPGLYKSAGTLAVTGNVTLDGQGDANAVFIFQIASSLDTASGSAVTLIGGALAGNVFWQVGSSATFGTTTAFKGTIMANQSISFGTGATLDGRALARIAAVNCAANSITLPLARAVPPCFGPSHHATNGWMTLTLTNTPGLTFTVQSSTNLINWTNLVTRSVGVSPATLIDSNTSGVARRFYRAFYP